MHSLILFLVIFSVVAWGIAQVAKDLWQHRRNGNQNNTSRESDAIADAAESCCYVDIGQPAVHMTGELTNCAPTGFDIGHSVDIGHCVEAIAHTISHP